MAGASPALAARAESVVTLAPMAEDVGLAVMLFDLIRQNLEQNPRRWSDFEKMDSDILVVVRDADVSVTLSFRRGALVVHGGVYGFPRILIATTAEGLLSLAMLKIVGGIPNLISRRGYGLVKSLARRELSIRGIMKAPIQLVRFTRLMSVNT